MTNKAESGHLSQAALRGLRALFEEISNDVSERNKCKLFVKRVLAAYEKEDFDTLSKQLSKEPNTIGQLYPKAQQTICDLQLDVDRKFDERFHRLSEQLAEYSNSKGIRLKGVSPNFVVDGLIQVVPDKKKKAVKVGASHLKSLDWNRVRNLLKTEWERVWGRSFDAVKYSDELLSAYKTIMEIKPNPSGWAPLSDVCQKLKEKREEENPNWREGGRVAGYYKDEFSADLSKLWAAQLQGSVSSSRIEFSAIRDPRKAYQVVMQGGDIANYGFLRPRQT